MEWNVQKRWISVVNDVASFYDLARQIKYFRLMILVLRAAAAVTAAILFTVLNFHRLRNASNRRGGTFSYIVSYITIEEGETEKSRLLTSGPLEIIILGTFATFSNYLPPLLLITITIAESMILSEIDKRHHRFISCGTAVIVVLWFICCISLYWNSPNYQLLVSEIYEGRWLLSALAVNVFFTYLFLQTPSLILFSALFVSNQYTTVYSVISFFVYTIDSVNVSMYSPAGRQIDVVNYLKISLTLIFISLIGFILSFYHIRRLSVLAWSYQEVIANTPQRLLPTCSVLHALLAFFSIYLCLETISMKTAFIQTFIVQEICCASLALVMSVVQSIFHQKANRLIKITIIVMNSCQFAQELAHAWSAYYVCVYMKSVSGQSSTQANLLFDQIMISITLLIHGFRLILCAFVIASLAVSAFEHEMSERIIFQPNPDLLISVAQAARMSKNDELSSLLLLLESLVMAVVYIAIDICYFVLNLTRRTLTASAGISLFYAIFLALSFHIYRRDHIVIVLKVGCTFAIVLLNCSLHTIYMFTEALSIGSSTEKVFGTFPNGVLYGAEVVIAIYATFVSIHCLRFNTRTILVHTEFQTQSSCIKAPLRLLNHLASVNFLTLALEFSLILLMKIGWKINDPSVNFEIHDWISVLSTVVLQKWVCSHERYQSCLLILILQLTVECVTTLSFLSSQTNYIQLMISIARSSANTDKLRQILPIDHIVIILTDHSLQVLQWAVAISSLGFSLIILNEIVTNANSSNDHQLSFQTNEAKIDHTSCHREPFNLNGFMNNVFEDETVQIVPARNTPSRNGEVQSQAQLCNVPSIRI